MKWIPRILSLTLLWGGVAAIILFVEPELIRDIIVPGLYLPLLILLLIALWYSLALIFKSAMISLMFASTVIGSLILIILRFMHWGLAGVILLTLVMESMYTYHRYEKIHPANEQKD